MKSHVEAEAQGQGDPSPSHIHTQNESEDKVAGELVLKVLPDSKAFILSTTFPASKAWTTAPPPPALLCH